MFTKFSIFCGLILLTNIISSPQKDYGKFNIAVTDFHICNGPKSKDCCTWVYRSENERVFFFEADLKENMPSVKGKVVVSMNGKELFRLQMNKLCDHLFVGPMVKTFLNFTSNCVIMKGHYAFEVDIEKAAQNYYGGHSYTEI